MFIYKKSFCFQGKNIYFWHYKWFRTIYLFGMHKKIAPVICLAILLLSCKQSYHVTEMSGTIVQMDSVFDHSPHQKMQALVQSYKGKLDKEMNEPIGYSAQFMDYKRPESLLTNLTSDVMKAYGDEHLPQGADMGVMNVHGHRATLPKGKITVGNLYEIYSFDNTLTFLALKGSDLKNIFDAYARIGGAGESEKCDGRRQTRAGRKSLLHSHPRLPCRGKRQHGCLPQRNLKSGYRHHTAGYYD